MLRIHERAPVTRRMLDNQGGLRAARMSQSSEEGAMQPPGYGVDCRAPSEQKCACCLPSRRTPSGQDSVDSQEGNTYLGGEVSNDHESA